MMRDLKNRKEQAVEPKIGTHGYDGAYCPGARRTSWMQSFSVGCFEWLPKKGGGVKRSKAKVRVRGSTRDAELVYERAEDVCRQLDAGTYKGPKVVTVKHS